MRLRKVMVGAVVVGLVGGGLAAAAAMLDFGVARDAELDSNAVELFGVDAGLAQSSTVATDKATALANPASLITVAPGLSVRVVSANVLPPFVDQMALWPNDTSPTYAIACNEALPTAAASVVRINLSTGGYSTIVKGIDRCDGLRRTAWGTIVFGEERSTPDGRLYELVDPLGTTLVVADRVNGTFSGGTGAANLATRPAVGQVAWEGLALLASGVFYYTDENRPTGGSNGGRLYKFLPSTPWPGGAPITDLSQSPLVAGRIYALRVGLYNGGRDYGPGSSYGKGTWNAVCGGSGQPLCADLVLRNVTTPFTGGYRPEDMELDPIALAAGTVRMCNSRTGEEATTGFFGEIVCITDGSPAQALANTAVPELQPFVLGNPALDMPDNLAFQPGRGNAIVHEDNGTTFGQRNDDLWSCLPDGADVDLQSDGCLRVMTLNDRAQSGSGFNPSGAEPTGGIFTADGQHFYLSVMHNVTGKVVLLDITGWK